MTLEEKLDYIGGVNAMSIRLDSKTRRAGKSHVGRADRGPAGYAGH